MRKKHRLRLFENGLLRKISGTKSREVTGEWRRLHKKELHILHSLKNTIIHHAIKSIRMRCAPCGTMGDRQVAHRDLVGRPERKKSHGRPRRRWEDNIKIVL